jgi:hypothetical protein
MSYFIAYACLFPRFDSALACLLFQENQAKTLRNWDLDQAFTPTDGPQARPKSHAAAT